MSKSNITFADRAKEYYNLHMITPAQCRAARALLGISQAELHDASKVGLSSIQSFEREERKPIFRNMLGIRETLENAGIEFLFEDEEGVGVRFSNKTRTN